MRPRVRSWADSPPQKLGISVRLTVPEGDMMVWESLDVILRAKL